MTAPTPPRPDESQPDYLAEGLAKAKEAGIPTRLVEVRARWLDNGRCCGRKPRRYQIPDPHLVCLTCSAEFDLDGNQRANWAWEQTKRGFVIKSWPLANGFMELVRIGRIDRNTIIREIPL